MKNSIMTVLAVVILFVAPKFVLAKQGHYPLLMGVHFSILEGFTSLRES
jgi:hypothetical protein